MRRKSAKPKDINAKRHNEHEDDRTPLSTGMTAIDDLMKGGLRAGELGIVMASPGADEAQALQYFMRQAWVNGLNVMYVSLTLPLQEAYQRIASYLGDRVIRFNDVPTKLPGTRGILFGVDDDAEKGTYFIQCFRANEASCGDLFIHIICAIEHSDWKPDLIVLDCANAVRPGRAPHLSSDGLTAIFEELAGIATEFQVPVWTGTSDAATVLGITRGQAAAADYVFGVAHDDCPGAEVDLRLVSLKAPGSDGPVEEALLASFPATAGRQVA